MPDPPEGEGPEAEAIVRQVEADADAIAVPEELLVEPEHPPGAAAPVEPPIEARNLYARVLAMGMAEKIKLALRGNKDVRLILARDATKMIRRLVLLNPRISDGEVIAFARNRSIDEELIRLIAERREWMRNYQVRLALATNPNTPLTVALKQVGTLGERDLRQLAKSKNVSATVAAQARRLLLARQQPGSR
jgi:hypothetical protein